MTPGFGTPADGQATVAIEIRLINKFGDPMRGIPVELVVSGYANVLKPLAPTDEHGFTRGTLRSLAGERKELLARIRSPADHLTELGPRTAVFLHIPENTWFVRATAGSDGNTGRTPLQAWRTLAHALNQVGPGATIYVGAGLYVDSLEIAHVSSVEAPLVLHGDRSGCYTGDPGDVVIDAGGAPSGIRLQEAENAVLRGLTVRGAAAGLRIEDSSHASVLDCRMIDNGFGVLVEGANALALENCRISNNTADGIRLEGTQGSVVANNLIYNNAGTGLLFFYQPSNDTAITFNTFYRNGGDQLREEQPGGTGRIEDNIIAEGGAACIRLAPGSSLQNDHNLIWGNAERNIPRGTPDGNIEADPRFADPFGPDGILGGAGDADDDFRTLEGSAALDLSEALARDAVLRSNEPLSVLTTREDLVPDGGDADLPAANLGFHYPIPLDPFLSLEHGGGRIAHAIPGDVALGTRSWSRTTALRGLERPQALNAELSWVLQRVSPRDRPEEIIAALADTGTETQLFVRVWDGWRWSEPFDSPFARGLAREDARDRAFDLEYEQRSGRALLVRANGDTNPLFRILEDGRWSAEQPAFEAPFGTGKILWLELVPYAGSNELALLVLDDERDLFLTGWSGNHWTPPLLLEDNTVYTSGWRPFDAAWESSSGDLLITWGFNVYIEETRWAVFERRRGAWRFGQHPSTDAIGAHIVLAADPTSDRIAAVMGEGDLDNDVIVSVWNGEDWVATAELTLAAPQATHAVDVAWMGGNAFVVFRRQGHEGSFNCAIYRPTGWKIQPDVVLPGTARAVQVELGSVPGEDRLLGLLLDEQGQLFALRFEGVRFALMNGGLPLASGLDPLAPWRSFDLALRRP